MNVGSDRERTVAARRKWLTLAAILGLAWWFFGNLYEAVVFSPNWVTDSVAQMTRLNAFFVRTSPTLYFVPVTMIATVLTWALFFTNTNPAIRPAYRAAAALAALATAVNLVVVTAVVPKTFGPSFVTEASSLTRLLWTWSALNLVRGALVAAAVGYLFRAFRQLDRADAVGQLPRSPMD
jgi:hypothetical protein